MFITSEFPTTKQQKWKGKCGKRRSHFGTLAKWTGWLRLKFPLDTFAMEKQTATTTDFMAFSVSMYWSLIDLKKRNFISPIRKECKFIKWFKYLFSVWGHQTVLVQNIRRKLQPRIRYTQKCSAHKLDASDVHLSYVNFNYSEWTMQNCPIRKQISAKIGI